MQSTSFQRRLQDIVVLVLASQGCAPEPEPLTPKHIADVDLATTGTASATATTTTPPDGLILAEGTGTPPPPLEAGTAKEFCAAYKARTQVDASKAQTIDTEGSLKGTSDWGEFDATNGQARCTLIRSTTTTKAMVTRTATCCPMSRPCPPPAQVMADVEVMVLERVTLTRDGAVVQRSVERLVSDLNPMPRHNCGRTTAGVSMSEHAGSAASLRSMNARARDADLACRMAELEAASVPAFARLAAELEALGAPVELVARAERARLEEERHVEQMTALARRYDAAPRTPCIAPLPLRSALAVALENATEGCVRETFGALVATHQAARAEHGLRRTFTAIAADERAHAELSADVGAWLEARLTEGEREEVRAAREQAIAELREELADAPASEALGLPGPGAARALFDAWFGGSAGVA